ncbi:hypothetical protein WJX84_007708 [Apatococcus fuscideae]|uniref:Myb-like domain-containing protein n=1 Tax=Apatococcus fuscideae TaxID=2026836 RepID=A0AAW1T2I3_9CHLO
MDLSALDKLPNEGSDSRNPRFKPRARPVARKPAAASKSKAAASKQPITGASDPPQLLSNSGGSQPTQPEPPSFFVAAAAPNAAEPDLSLHPNQEVAYPSSVQPESSGPPASSADALASLTAGPHCSKLHGTAAAKSVEKAAAARSAVKRVRFSQDTAAGENEQLQQTQTAMPGASLMHDNTCSPPDAATAPQQETHETAKSVKQAPVRGRGWGRRETRARKVLPVIPEANDAAAASADGAGAISPAGGAPSQTSSADMDWEADEKGAAVCGRKRDRGLGNKGEGSRGKRGRKSYADLALESVDRKTATLSQLVHHAVARERLKADEEKRMREEGGEEEGESVEAPAGRVRPQGHKQGQQQPPQPASQAAVMAPRVVLRDGIMQVDIESLTVEAQESLEDRKVVTTEALVNSASYSNRCRPERWTAEDTELFYQLLAKFGTDFQTMQKLMPGRSRSQLKTKYGREQKLNAERIDLALKGQAGGCADGKVSCCKLLAKFGTDFQTMQKLMPGRSRSQLKTKYGREQKLNAERIDLALKGQAGGCADGLLRTRIDPQDKARDSPQC